MELQHFSHTHPLIFIEEEDECDDEGAICSGCEGPISGPRYRCNTSCVFFLHKKCAELPLEIKQHGLHPEHPLFLLPKPPPEYSSGVYICDFCNLTFRSFIYHCSFCQFDLDIKCAFPPCFSEPESQDHHLKSIQSSSHPHPLILNEEQDEYDDQEVICSVCKEEISGPHYRCTSSMFFLHKRCAEMPKEVKHYLHPEHPLFLLANPQTSKNRLRGCVCNFCNGCCESFVYCCSFCQINLHTKCVFPLCFSEAESKGQDLKSINHFSHPHPLILNKEQDEYDDGQGVICPGCEEPTSDPHYRCTSCKFSLHKKCAEMPKEIKHYWHPEHPLFLLAIPRTNYRGGGYVCNFCQGYCESFHYSCFVYRCSFCEYNLHAKCVFPPCFSEAESQGHQLKSIQHFSHPHPLILNEEPEEYNNGGVICLGCGQPISGPHYRCSASKKFLHKRCAEMPNEIKHYWHPKHPLSLLAISPLDGEGNRYCCDLCQKICNNFVYHCSSCYFNLDIKCAFPTCLFEGRHQFIHLLNYFQFKSSSFICNFCGTNDNHGLPYLCTLCQVIFHEDCIASPKTISIRQHPHLLTYNYFLQGEGYEMPHCGVCQIPFNTGHGGYNCKDCNFFAHANCAKKYIATSSEIETRNNECMDSSITCSEVKHFSHEHSLILIEEDKSNAQCAGCMLPVSAPSYGCSLCNFFLHKRCIELKRRMKVSVFSATLSSKAPTINGAFCCDLCFQYCDGFAYNVNGFNRMFDVRCGINLSSGAITHESHEHRLFFTEADEGRCCEGCGNDCRFGSFRCVPCDFTLDFRCANLPREARHRYDEHLLLLAYVDPNDYQYVCQVCEKERDPKLWFYRCEECDFDAHIECVLREYHPYVKLGNTCMYDFHPHPLVLVEKIEDYPECHTCGDPCDELALECTDPLCDFIIHTRRKGTCNR